MTRQEVIQKQTDEIMDEFDFVIVGAGFAGLKLARKLARLPYQVVLLDRNNYHQFQPLFYQVATQQCHIVILQDAFVVELSVWQPI